MASQSNRRWSGNGFRIHVLLEDDRVNPFVFLGFIRAIAKMVCIFEEFFVQKSLLFRPQTYLETNTRLFGFNPPGCPARIRLTDA